MDAGTFHALLRPVPDSRAAMTPDDGNGNVWSNALLDALSAAGGRSERGGAGRFAAGYLRLTSDQDQMTRPTMHFCQSPSKSSMRLKTRGGLSAALSE